VRPSVAVTPDRAGWRGGRDRKTRDAPNAVLDVSSTRAWVLDTGVGAAVAGGRHHRPVEVPQELILGRRASCSGLMPTCSDDRALWPYVVAPGPRRARAPELNSARKGPMGL